MSFFGKKTEDKTKAPEKAVHADLGRNDPCHCGSGKKYKKCCMTKDEAKEHKVLEEQWKKAASVVQEQTEKKAKDTPTAPTKSTNKPTASGQHHPTFVPHQVSMPRKSGGGG